VRRRSFEVGKDLVLLRRVTPPMREVLNTLIRQDLGVVGDLMMPFYQDIFDHVLRATEWTESLRDLVTTMVETNLTVQANRMNLIMKNVTSWAAIIAVPTAITGFYGQDLPYPGFGKESGLIFSSALIPGFVDPSVCRVQTEGLAMTPQESATPIAAPDSPPETLRGPGCPPALSDRREPVTAVPHLATSVTAFEKLGHVSVFAGRKKATGAGSASRARPPPGTSWHSRLHDGHPEGLRPAG
jgi:hypothetical protein